MEWHRGNAIRDKDDRGWFIGHFVPDELKSNYSEAVEIKWSEHLASDSQDEWQASEGTSLTVLIDGVMSIYFVDGEARLAMRGDYAMWQPGTHHKWTAFHQTTVMTVRWPSHPPRNG